MPLYQKKRFVPQAPPQNLRKDELVFFCPLTKEIFREYDEFFERTILLNSMCWSCEVTGKTGLTYEEALDSERRAQEALSSFPEFLEAPLLYIAGLTHRGKLDDVINDVWTFMKGRYFVGEVVEMLGAEGERIRCRVLRVVCNASVEIGQLPSVKKQKKVEKEAMASAEGSWLEPTCYSYEVQLNVHSSDSEPNSSDDEDEQLGETDDSRVLIPNTEIIRQKSLATKERVRLFLKNSLECKDGRFVVKAELQDDFDLPTVSWSDHIFGGVKPIFPKTPSKRVSNAGTPNSTQQAAKGGKKSEGKTTPAKHKRLSKADKERLELLNKIEKQQHELQPLFEQATKVNLPKLSVWQQKDKLLAVEEIGDLREAIKKQRDLDREKKREEQRRMKEELVLWKQPRDDLLCDDLKPLPEFKAVPLLEDDWMTAELFGRCLSVFEFFHSFADILNVGEKCGSKKISFGLLATAIKGGSEEADEALFELISILLRCKANIANEEDGDEANLNNKEELAAENCDLDNKTYSSFIREACVLHENVRQIHGMSVRHLPVEKASLTEVVRLGILTAGYYCGASTSRFRYIHRGGYKCWDDVALLFRMERPHLLDKLNKVSLYELETVEKVDVVQLLCDQLLNFFKFRQCLEQNMEQLKALKSELKQVKAWNTTQAKSALNAKLLREEYDRHEAEKLETAEQVAAEGKPVQQQEEEDEEEGFQIPKASKETERLKVWLRRQREGRVVFSRRQPCSADYSSELLHCVAFLELEPSEVDECRLLQSEHASEQERTLLGQIHQLQSRCGLAFVGSDRAHRRYYWTGAFPVLLVEQPNADLLLGRCQRATPLDKVSPNGVDETGEFLLRRRLLVCSGKSESCAVHGARQRNTWLYFLPSRKEELESFISSLNVRGFRETELRENISFLADRLLEKANECAEHPFGEQFRQIASGVRCDSRCSHTIVDLRREILKLEEKIHANGIGAVGAGDRAAWRRQAETDAGIVGYGVSVAGETIYSAEELARLTSVSRLAVALLHVSQAVQLKFLQMPFAGPIWKMENGTLIADIDLENGIEAKEALLLWQRSLLGCASPAQVALHTATFEASILWKKSRKQARCRWCHRKGEADAMASCSRCNKAGHTFCCKPPLERPPPVGTDWLCSACADVFVQPVKKRPSPVLPNRRSSSSYLIETDRSTTATPNGDACHRPAAKKGRGRPRKLDKGEPKLRTTKCVEPVITSSGRVVKSRPIFDLVDDDDDVDHERSRARQSGGKCASRMESKENGAASDSSSDEPLVKKRTSIKRLSRKSSSEDEGEEWSAAFRRRRSGAQAQLKLCQQLVEEARRLPDAWPFREPVNKKQVPLYYTVIERPMDLHTMLNKLKNRKYDSAEEVYRDSRLMFDNCRFFNEDESEVAQCGHKLEVWLNEQFGRRKLVVTAELDAVKSEGNNSAAAAENSRILPEAAASGDNAEFDPPPSSELVSAGVV